MSFHRGPNIVRDGLVLYMDAGNTKSYPGTGTVWTDLKNSYPGTLSGATYSSLYNGCMSFNGVDNYVELSSITLPTNITVSAWIYRTGAPTGFNPIVELGSSSGSRYFRFVSLNYTLCFGNDGQTNNFYRTNTSFSLLNTWYNVVAMYDGTYRIFVNGIETTVYQNTGAYAAWLTSKLNIGYRPYDSTVKSFTGFIPMVKIYNRALTPTEVLQNYNTTKPRFGL